MIVASVSALAADDGSITITNAEIGKTYSLYKLFDATVGPNGETAYMLPDGKNVTNDTFFNMYFEIKNGNIIPKSEFTEAVLKTDDFKTWATGFGTQVGETQTATGDTVAFNNLAYGYYFVTTNNGSVITVDSANKSASVIDKNAQIDFDKNIILQAAAEGKEEVLGKFNEAGLDIPVPFVIDVTSKNYDGADKVFKYRIKDTIDTGFTFTDDPVVKVGDATLATTAYTIKYYTDATKQTEVTAANKAQAQYFEIIIPWTTDGTVNGDHLYSNNAKIRVTYNAILDHNKAANVKVGADPNLNNADLDYWKNTDSPDSDTPSGTKPRKTTKTWETALTIIKTDDKGAELKGAQFTLSTANGTKVSYVWKQEFVQDNANGTHWKLKDGTYTTDDPKAPNMDRSKYESTENKYKLEERAEVVQGSGTASSMSAYVGEDGKVKFSGLGTGTYTIEETVVPDGFNKADNITFTISFAVDNTDPQNPVGKFSSDNAKIVLDATNNVFNTTIVNNKGVELPETGGMGTTILYIGGSILVLAAVILLITKRRMNAED